MTGPIRALRCLVVGTAFALAVTGCASAPVSGEDVDPATQALRVPKTDPGPPVFTGSVADDSRPWAGASGPVPLGADDAAFTRALRERFPPGSSLADLMTAIQAQGFACTGEGAASSALSLRCGARAEEGSCTVDWQIRASGTGGVVVALAGTRFATCPSG
jgi:hypothetical protein